MYQLPNVLLHELDKVTPYAPVASIVYENRSLSRQNGAHPSIGDNGHIYYSTNQKNDYSSRELYTINAAHAQHYIDARATHSIIGKSKDGAKIVTYAWEYKGIHVTKNLYIHSPQSQPIMISPPCGVESPYDIQINEDCTLIAIPSGNKTYVYAEKNGWKTVELSTPIISNKTFNPIKFSPCGKYLLTDGLGGQLNYDIGELYHLYLLWNVKDGALKATCMIRNTPLRYGFFDRIHLHGGGSLTALKLIAPLEYRAIASYNFIPVKPGDTLESLQEQAVSANILYQNPCPRTELSHIARSPNRKYFLTSFSLHDKSPHTSEETLYTLIKLDQFKYAEIIEEKQRKELIQARISQLTTQQKRFSLFGAIATAATGFFGKSYFTAPSEHRSALAACTGISAIGAAVGWYKAWKLRQTAHALKRDL